MSDWIKKLQDQRVAGDADTDIERQKYEIAVAATPRLSTLLLEQVKADIADFKTKFHGERVELIIPDPMGGYDLRVRTQRYPLLTVQYRFGTAQLEYKKQRMETDDSRMVVESGAVRVVGHFDQSCTYQHQGKVLMTTEELAQILLLELLTEASK